MTDLIVGAALVAGSLLTLCAVTVTALAVEAIHGTPAVVVDEPAACGLEWDDIKSFVISARADIEEMAA